MAVALNVHYYAPELVYRRAAVRRSPPSWALSMATTTDGAGRMAES
jgi:hypothetical protein